MSVRRWWARLLERRRHRLTALEQHALDALHALGGHWCTLDQVAGHPTMPTDPALHGPNARLLTEVALEGLVERGLAEHVQDRIHLYRLTEKGLNR